MGIFDGALRITERLAESLSGLEVHCATVFDRSVPLREDVRAAISMTWPRLIADAHQSRVTHQVHYVAALHQQLTETASLEHSGQLVDRADVPWEVYYRDGCGDEPRREAAWVVCELFWGGYVSALHISLGWLLMDAIRLQNGLVAITPTPNTFDRSADDLRCSGPELFDAESLRGLFYDYEATQIAG